MPRKNSVKKYYENGFYHIYNRGVEKRETFCDRDDYLRFLHILKTALSDSPREGSTLTGRFPRKNFFGKIDLLAYCLLPNHLHLQIRQAEPTAITQFMHSICTSYSMYFNKKYQRVGPLFQGIFKAIDIEDENYLIWVNRYIHRNPPQFRSYPYSSYEDYLGIRHTDWVNCRTILECFSSSRLRQRKNFRKFVEDDNQEPVDLSFYTFDVEDNAESLYRPL